MTLEQRTDYGGIIRDPRYWATSAGYGFMAHFGDASVTAALSSTNDGLSGYGWAFTGLGGSVSAADLLSSSDRGPGRFHIADAAGEGFSSPRIFGSYDHALQASRFLGYFPTKLTLEILGRWQVATTNETTGFFGFHDPAGTDAAAAGCPGAIVSDGTNFLLVSDNGSDTGAAIDTNWHTWKIEVDATTTQWFIDDVSQGTITTEADVWPTSIRMVSTANNDHNIAFLRVFYS